MTKIQETLSESNIVKGALEVLQGYVDESFDVEFKNDVIVVPPMTKEYFSGLFDTVASIIVSEVMSGKWASIDRLRLNYRKAEREFKQSTDIEIIVLPKDTRIFFDDPVQVLGKSIRYLIFDYMRGCLSYAELMQRAIREIGAQSMCLWNRGYEAWLYVSLLNAFSPRQVCKVELDESGAPLTVKTKILEPGNDEYLTGKRLPDAVVTTKYQKHYAIKLEPLSNISCWTSVDRPCLLVYEISSLDALSDVIAYAWESLPAPSFSVEVASEEEIKEESFCRDMSDHAAVLRSDLGHFVVVPTDSKNEIISQMSSDNMHILAMEYNITELHASVSSFAPYRRSQSRYNSA